MLLFFIGMIGFFGLHMLPFFPKQRRLLIKKIESEYQYRILIVVFSILFLLLMVLGKGAFPYVELWYPPITLRYLSLISMYMSLIFITASQLPSSIQYQLRHPMLVGVLIWAITHLIVNGDIGSILLFLSFSVYSVAAMILTNRTRWSSPATWW